MGAEPLSTEARGPLMDHSGESPEVFVFGPHIGSSSKEAMDRLIQPISQGPHRQWILEAISELPNYWEALIENIPEIETAIPGLEQINDLGFWLRHGQLDMPKDAQLPNIIITPLVVMIQLTQYWQYLELTQSGDVADPHAELVRQQLNGTRSEFLGFCLGMLGALAVASAHDRKEFERFGCVALRLAVLLGALVDARNVWDTSKGKGKAASLAVAWINAKQAEDVTSIVEALSPDAHIAVRFDTTRATIITTESVAPGLTKRLRAEAGAIVHELGMQAHIHSPDPAWEVYTDILLELCESMPGLQYADVAEMALPTYSNNVGGDVVLRNSTNVTEMVVRGILVKQCDWIGTLSAVMKDQEPLLVTLGLDKCIPPSLVQRVGSRQIFFPEDEARLSASEKPRSQIQQAPPVSMQKDEESMVPQALITPDISNDAIAVIGMSVKTAGADDLAEFAAMLKKGESQHEVITRNRLPHDMLYRTDPEGQRQWYGCFVRDSDAFDHKFFKRSPRESAAMDPQGRITLECAYQAVEQSGYFAGLQHDKHVGVYLGVAGVEYDQNAVSNEPNAFTATGQLRSFISGRLSHHFGWTGPSMMFDTACSSSTIAVHTACRNILSGECTAALAGGSNIIAGMRWHQDMAAGGFLSPSGQCKPFDDSADGYCRAEGFGFVFLKRQSDAIRDGNPILATIPATAVHQNQNITPLFVPNAPSLTILFREVLRKAGLTAKEISLVEAHGTGTAVGDPAEYEAICAALGGSASGREIPLPFGSLKGFIGHAEAASGVLSLIKVIMMMQQGFIPAQASHTKMNQKIRRSPEDMMEIVTKLRPWDNEHKIALINNYGACGSNASLIVTQSASPLFHTSNDIDRNLQYPFWIPGLDARAVIANSKKLASYVSSLSESTNTIADVSFNLSRSSNRHLSHGYIFSCRSITELQKKLSQASDDFPTGGVGPVKNERPVVLCFGGQNSLHVGLDRKLYDTASVFREHLDEVDAVAVSLGVTSIFPDIFSRQPIRDTVKLQTMLFAMQYACAKSWASCGLETNIAAVVGHSFGEITALCVAGALSLQDAVILVSTRARLVQSSWGSDTGAMMAVQADLPLVDEIVRQANDSTGSDGSACIACYNGPTSFTLAGTTAVVDILQSIIQGHYPQIKSKRLEVTNAFHSNLVDKLVEDLDEVGKRLTFQEPIIPIERATKEASDTQLDWTFVSKHMRQPVFFNHAVQRLTKKLPNAIFLEAGSNSTITAMAARALKTDADHYHFQGLSVTNCDSGFDGLTSAVISLWRQGLRVSFWAHHRMQASEYRTMLLPPYQFDKSPTSRHWLSVKSPSEEVNKRVAEALSARDNAAMHVQTSKNRPAEGPLRVWEFLEHPNGDEKDSRFRINPASDRYKELVSAHVVANTAPICPATLIFDIIVETSFSLDPTWKESGTWQPTVRDMVNHSPICFDQSRVFYLDLTATDGKHEWFARFFSVESLSGKQETHVEATVQMRSLTDPQCTKEFSRLARLIDHNRTTELLGCSVDEEGIEVIQGRQLYRAFDHVVEYSDIYRGVKYVIGRGYECAGRVQLDRSHRRNDTWLDVPLSDCFAQVGGMWANIMSPSALSGSGHDIYIASGVELLMRSPSHTTTARSATDVWHVHALHTKHGPKAYMTDMFIFDPKTGELVEVMLGVQWGCVAKASMSRMLQLRTKDESVLRSRPEPKMENPRHVATKIKPMAVPMKAVQFDNDQSSVRIVPQRDYTADVRKLVARLVGLEPDELELDADMAAYGIDSLMGMELSREVEQQFKCLLDHAEQMRADTLRKFVACVEKAVGQQVAPTMTDELPLASILKPKPQKITPHIQSKGRNIADEIRTIISTLMGTDAAEMDLDAEIMNYGIDSLMGMELGRDVERQFSCTLDRVEQIKANTLRKFIVCVENAMTSAEGSTRDLEQEDDQWDRDPQDVSWNSSLTTSEQDTDSSGNSLAGSPLSSASSTPPPTLDRLTVHTSKLVFSTSDILATFGSVKLLSNHTMDQYGLDKFEKAYLAESNRLCTVLIVEALEELGHSLRDAQPGQELARLSDLSQNSCLIEWLYKFLETDARLVNINATTGQMTRTHLKMPDRASAQILQDLQTRYHEFIVATNLTYEAGKQLAATLSGRTDDLVSKMSHTTNLITSFHSQHPFFRAGYDQMCQIIQGVIERSHVREQQQTLKILEVGGGTGGLTQFMASFLASLDVPVEYTFTDTSPHLVNDASKRMRSQYPFMRFAILDTNNVADSEFGDQHVVLVNSDLSQLSLSNTHRLLRSSGFLLASQMTEIVPFIDMIFGVLGTETDVRWQATNAATMKPKYWEAQMHAAGFGHVDWTDGDASANTYQKVMIALASGSQCPPLPRSVSTVVATKIDNNARQTEAQSLVQKYADGWATSRLQRFKSNATDERATPSRGAVVLVTGATGSLGSHIVQKLAENPTVSQVVCVNRDSVSVPALKRQQEAFSERGIKMLPGARSKVRVLGTDISKPQLGLPAQEYAWLVQNGTHIVHNAWPMSWTRPLAGFAPQLQSMRNLLDLAREMAISPSRNSGRIGFQFVSSIGVVGLSGEARVAEDRVPLAHTIPRGYGEAKWICETLLDETLHKYPTLFRAHVTRPGQLAGSSTSGYWNTIEHLPFYIKSAQSLGVWPQLAGTMQWIPVDLGAGVVTDLLLNPDASYPVYHIDNPVGQPWKEMNSIIAGALDISESTNVIPFKEWVRRVRVSPLVAETENPAARPGMPEWLETNFERMACGGLILSTSKAQEHSVTMAKHVGPVSAEVVVKILDYWRSIGFLE